MVNTDFPFSKFNYCETLTKFVRSQCVMSLIFILSFLSHEKLTHFPEIGWYRLLSVDHDWFVNIFFLFT